jgi:hypothetical protein
MVGPAEVAVLLQQGEGRLEVGGLGAGGPITIHGPAGAGTTLLIDLPVDPEGG